MVVIFSNKNFYRQLDEYVFENVTMVYDMALLISTVTANPGIEIVLFDTVLRNGMYNDALIVELITRLKKTAYCRIIYVFDGLVSKELERSLVGANIFDIHVIPQEDVTPDRVLSAILVFKNAGDFKINITLDDNAKQSILGAIKHVIAALAYESDEALITFFKTNSVKLNKLFTLVSDIVYGYTTTVDENEKFIVEINALKTKLSMLAEASAAIETVKLKADAQLAEKDRLIENLDEELAELKKELNKAINKAKESGTRVDTTSTVNVNKTVFNIETCVYLKILSDVRYLKSLLTYYKEYLVTKGKRVRLVILESPNATANMKSYPGFAITDTGLVDESIIFEKDCLLVKEPRKDVMDLLLDNKENYDVVIFVDNTRVDNIFMTGKGVKKVFASNSKSELIRMNAPFAESIGYDKGTFNIQPITAQDRSFSSITVPKIKSMVYSPVCKSFDEFLESVSSSMI